MKTITPSAFRRQLHSHPELSFKEFESAAFISRCLTDAGIEHRPIATTGLLATIRGRRAVADNRAVVLRADIDALPITEATGLPYASQNPGVMHACGHDMHAAALYGVLCRLAADPDFPGTVLGLFQPGEESNPGGASLVLQEHPFDDYTVRAVIGEHVEPQFEVGTLGFRAGKYMASSDELRFYVRGRGGHGAMRSLLRDPVEVAAQLITALLTLNQAERVLSIGKVRADGATNVIPDEVYLEGTMRTFNEELRHAGYDEIEAIAKRLGEQFGVEVVVDISRGYPCVTNDAALVERAVALAGTQGRHVEMLPLRSTAEDFGFYTLHYPSIFYRLGVGSSAGRTHNAQFTPDEAALDVAIPFMRDLALQLLQA